MGEREKADLAAIKGRENEARDRIKAGLSVDIANNPFTMEQLGLKYPMVDDHGRLWIVRGNMLVRIGYVAERP